MNELTLRGTTKVPTTLETVVAITAKPAANPIQDPTTSAFNRTRRPAGTTGGLQVVAPASRGPADSHGPRTPVAQRGAPSSSATVEDFVEGDNHVVRAELPSVDPDKNIDITVQGGVLTIRAERNEEKSEKNRSEFRYGSFVRSVPLPEGVKQDTVKAAHKDGILTVRVGLAQPSTEAKKISIPREE